MKFKPGDIVSVGKSMYRVTRVVPGGLYGDHLCPTTREPTLKNTGITYNVDAFGEYYHSPGFTEVVLRERDGQVLGVLDASDGGAGGAGGTEQQLPDIPGLLCLTRLLFLSRPEVIEHLRRVDEKPFGPSPSIVAKAIARAEAGELPEAKWWQAAEDQALTLFKTQQNFQRQIYAGLAR